MVFYRSSYCVYMIAIDISSCWLGFWYVPVRLVGGNNPAEGRVELYLYPHGWGTVCDNWFENIDAEVACRMLGFSGGEAFGNAFFGEGRGEIVLDHLECTGSESDLWDCPRGGRGEHNCLHAHDASVRCGKYHDADPENKHHIKWLWNMALVQLHVCIGLHKILIDLKAKYQFAF